MRGLWEEKRESLELEPVYGVMPGTMYYNEVIVRGKT